MPDPLTSTLISSLINALVESALLASTSATPYAVPTPAGLVRALPQEAKRGWMQMLGVGEVIIDGQVLRLSPATQLRGANNMIVPPPMVGHLMAGASSLPVKYTLDPMGAVHRIWILSRAELAAESSAVTAKTPFSAD